MVCGSYFDSSVVFSSLLNGSLPPALSSLLSTPSSKFSAATFRFESLPFSVSFGSRSLRGTAPLRRRRFRRMRTTVSHMPSTKRAKAAATSPANAETESGPILLLGLALGDGTAPLSCLARIRGGFEPIWSRGDRYSMDKIMIIARVQLGVCWWLPLVLLRAHWLLS